MSGIIVIAVHRSGRDHADRRIRLLTLHHPRLYTAGLRAQQEIIRNIKSILHVSGRMVFGKIQGFKVKIIIVNFGPFHHVKAHMHENLFNRTVRQRNGMQMAALRFTSRQCNIHGIVGQLRLQRFGFQNFRPFF